MDNKIIYDIERTHFNIHLLLYYVYYMNSGNNIKLNFVRHPVNIFMMVIIILLVVSYDNYV